MKTATSFIFLAMVTVIVAYTDDDDSPAFEALLRSPEELRILLDCYLDKIPCPPRFVAYRKHAQEAVDDACKECNTIQKHNVKLLLDGFQQLFPGALNDLTQKYDNDATHFGALVKEVSKY